MGVAYRAYRRPLQSNPQEIPERPPPPIQDSIADKCKTIAKNMTKKGWKSGMAKLDIVVDPKSFKTWAGSEAAAYAGDDGGCPWVVAYRPNLWRLGPSEFPLPGLGSIVIPVNKAVLVTGFDIGQLVQLGMGPADLKTFLESETGVGFAREHIGMSLAQPRTAVWVPCGIAPTLTCPVAKGQDPQW